MSHHLRFARYAIFATLILAANSVGAIQSAQAAQSAQATQSSPLLRIVNGQNAPNGSWPFAVALVRRELPNARDGAFCGGSYLGSRWVLTAAHCVEGTAATTIDVVAGRKDLTRSSKGYRVHVMRTIIHPGYNKPVELANDIALVRLRRALPVTSVALAQRSQDPKQNTVVSIAGWGCLRQLDPGDADPGDTIATCSAPDAITNKLQQTNVSIVAGPYCAGTMSPVGGVVNPVRQVCASQFNGPPRDACLGDSGGPLVRTMGGRRILVGITSWSVGCAWYPFQGVYTRVSAYQRWISANTGLR